MLPGKRKRAEGVAPATHDIAVSGKDLGQRGNDHVRKRQDVNVLEIPEGVVHDNGEAMAVSQQPQALEVRALEEGIRGELAKQAQDLLLLQELLELVQLRLIPHPKEVCAGTKLLQDQQRVKIRESGSK